MKASAHNDLPLATPVCVQLSSLSQWPGAPDQDRSAVARGVRSVACEFFTVCALSLYPLCFGLGAELPLVSGATYRGVIIPAETCQVQLSQFDGFWLPTTNDVAKAEAAIAQYLLTADKDSTVDLYTAGQVSTIRKRLKDYRRQYVSVIVGAEKRVLCNMLTPDDRRYTAWRIRYKYLVEGAPECWRIQYSLATGHCLNFNATFGY